ncbi:ABC transporter substrate-binding protein [Candidatus Bathyarchaeota archaeon]|nr:MAG: ABC transporter substrate-binding protein [Candidatus Bathyarchaeota archaeon]
MLRKRTAKIRSIAIIAVIIIIAAAIAGAIYYYRTTVPPPKPTKTFTAVMCYDFITDLDPAYSFSGEVNVMANVYETLLVYNPEGTGVTEYGLPHSEVAPGLAVNYTVSDDGLTWIFYLRKGVKFHDGTPFNATAVKYSIERIMELGVGAAFIWDPVEKIEIIDEYTVKFELSYPAPLQRIVASTYGAWIYSPKTAEIENLHDWFNEGHDAGSGPYMIESLERGVQITLKRFEDYWRGWEEHAEDRIDKVIYKIVEDPAVRVQMLETGEAQWVEYLPTEERKRFEAMPEFQVIRQPTYFIHYAFMNTKSPYLSDKLVRQALAYAFPYDDWIELGEGTYIKPPGPIPKGMWGCFEDLPQYTYNLTKAKELLAEAGYPNGGFKLKYYYISGAPTGTAGEMWKAELEKLGIELEVVGMTWPTLWERIKSGPEECGYDICAFAWWPTYITPYDFLYNMFHTEEKPFWNAAFYSNPEFDNLIDTAFKLEGSDPDRALELYREAQEILIEDCPAVFLDQLVEVFVLPSNVKGFRTNPAYGYTTIFFWYMWIEEEGGSLTIAPGFQLTLISLIFACFGFISLPRIRHTVFNEEERVWAV